MPAPSDRSYSPTHEWHKQEAGDLVTIGVTQFAVDELTDITYVSLPQVGKKIAALPFGEIESVKATADLNSAVAGEVVEINTALQTDPSLVNQDPYTRGWLIKVRAVGADLSGLLSADQYNARHEG